MSGQNAPVLDLPPGVLRNGTPHSVGRRWWDVNQVRWVDGQLQPIGGWAKGKYFGDDFGLLGDEWRGLSLDMMTNVSIMRQSTDAEVLSGPGPSSLETIRDAYSWRDNNKTPWYAVGTSTKLKAATPTSATIRDITPASLAVTTGTLSGYGAGLFGSGYYGAAVPTPIDNVGQWSLDNFGRYLVTVHSQDGRLFSWDPTTPTVIAAPVTNAPIDNTLVVVTDERMIMVLGGKGNPRRVKWCDRENMTVWAASATNTAGSFELNSGGTIIAAVRVQGGILVLTDVDAHIIEYVGAPYYYARRRLSEEVGCVGKNALVGVTGMGFWLSKEGYWRYDGNVTLVQSDVDYEVLTNGDLTVPANVFLGYNGFNREIWTFYPKRGSSTPDSYVFVSLDGAPYWSKGSLARTAFMNPVWDTKPYLYAESQEYQHEVGLLADGASRINDIFAETGEFEIGNGEQNMRVDRIWFDGSNYDPSTGTIYTSDYELLFKLRQAPTAPQRTIGPISPDNTIGYNSTRFRARSVQVRVEPVADTTWALGKVRLRMKSGGAR